MLKHSKPKAKWDYIAIKKLFGNQCYLIVAIFGHNLNWELQMASNDRDQETNAKRTLFGLFMIKMDSPSFFAKNRRGNPYPTGILLLLWAGMKSVTKVYLNP